MKTEWPGSRPPPRWSAPCARPSSSSRTSASGPFQYAVAEALALPDTYYTALRDDLQTKRDLLTAGLTDAGFQVHAPRGTYFITTDIAELAPGTDALTFCRALPEKCGVVAVPNSVFYDHPTAGRTQVRFAFCKRQDVLTQATERLRKAFKS